ncbi:MAG TPA: drug/metabolite exporter YedA [Planctomycetota bacterium]|nr:drug/metabolite exporter YedA [Planctomycetota bacterium]
MNHERTEATPLRIALAFAAVYLIWGSTYMAIRVAVADFAPFVMASIRFVVAGFALYGYLRLRGAPRPTWKQWRNASAIGFLLLSCSNGAVTWAEKTVPSGLAALLCAVLPMWMVLLEWLWDRTQRPTLQVMFGILLGLVGVAVLVGPGLTAEAGQVDFFGATLIVLASLTWALGSIYGRKADLPGSAAMSTAMEMIAGGAILAIGAWATGDWARFDPSVIPTNSWLALLYLAVFGSLIALSAYVWLLKASTPARVSTYAYVNPVVAVILGWALLDEPLTARTAVAAAIIVTALVVITNQRARGKLTSAPRLESEALAPTPIKR